MKSVSKLKPHLAFILTFIILLSMAEPVEASETLQPRYTYIQSFTFSLKIDDSTGLATCTGMIDIRTTDPVKIVLYLQKYEDGTWSTIKRWESNGSMCAALSKQIYVSKGYTYRLCAYGYVYDAEGTQLEADSGITSRYY